MNGKSSFYQREDVTVNFIDTNKNLYELFKTLCKIKINNSIWYHLRLESEYVWREKREGGEKVKEVLENKYKFYRHDEGFQKRDVSIFDEKILKSYEDNSSSEKFHIDMLGELKLSEEFMMERLINEMMFIPNSCFWSRLEPSVNDPTKKYPNRKQKRNFEFTASILTKGDFEVENLLESNSNFL